MPVRKLKPVEANDGSYGGTVLDAYDRLNQGRPLASEVERPTFKAPGALHIVSRGKVN